MSDKRNDDKGSGRDGEHGGEAPHADEAPEKSKQAGARGAVKGGEAHAREVDATGADADERDAKDELFEAIDHFKSAASILFGRATKDPTVKSATKEAGRIARKIGDAAEPLAKQLTDEISRLTRDVMDSVDGGRSKKRTAKQEKRASDEEE